MSPMNFLLAMIALPLAGLAAQWIVRQRRAMKLRRLARDWRMHYTAGDRFHLADRVARTMPLAGAAAVRVHDVIYGVEQDHYRYFFTAEYTSGVLGRKLDHRRVATLREPRDRAVLSGSVELLLAPAQLKWLQQYRQLRQSVSGTTMSSADLVPDET